MFICKIGGEQLWLRFNMSNINKTTSVKQKCFCLLKKQNKVTVTYQRLDVPWCMDSPSRGGKWPWPRWSLPGSSRGWRSPYSCGGGCSWRSTPTWWTSAPRTPETLLGAGWSRCAASGWTSCRSDRSHTSSRCCSHHLNRSLPPTERKEENKVRLKWHLTPKNFFVRPEYIFNCPIKTFTIVFL